MNRIDDFDTAYSRFRDDSLVARVATGPGEYEFPDDVVEFVELYKRLYDATNGAMSPLVGSSLSVLGYDKDYSLHAGQPVAAPDWKVTKWSGRILTTTQPVLLDFGAVGKGYLVDEVAEILEARGVADYVIDASGDVRHRGDDVQTIGLENPFDPLMVIGAAKVQSASLCASATNRRRWSDGLHHVVDARTGESTRDIVATWAVANSTALADGIATGLFFADAKQLEAVGSFEYVRMFADGHIEYSDGFVGELFI